MPFIDLNSDVGESFGSWTMGDDAAVFRYVSSANVACGFHAGDPSTIARTCREAVGQPVAVLEAMKMETVVSAHRSGTLTRGRQEPGTAVGRGEVLAIING